jgi:hypothetical protein
MGIISMAFGLAVYRGEKHCESMIRTNGEALFNMLRRDSFHDLNDIDGRNKMTLEVVECIPTPKPTI